MSQPKSHNTTYLKDYKLPDFLIKNVELIFDILDSTTKVISILQIERNFKTKQSTQLSLHGEALKLEQIILNGKTLEPTEYEINETNLIIFNVADKLTIEITTILYPAENTKLSGLYRTNNLLCTQCEPEGFRRITYYLDRPDVLAKMTVSIYADKKKYPVLLANGNLLEQGDIDAQRHFVKWVDPFPKPSYLFALVAGDLTAVVDNYVTKTGCLVTLKIFLERSNLNKAEHALCSLKKAMRWDEDNYGREYDLNTYMIVAVNDFNSGAMENKGLNIFNAKYILATSDIATDIDYRNIEDIIAHEYFHNWSGNRVTCRDWFQLSLKEGFTVAREREFSSYASKSAVARIDQVSLIKNQQFAEDAGPLAHPVQPKSYIEISNFYTLTIYDKGAEVIRMLKILLGEEKYRKATDLYFSRHDGEAVTIEEFIKAMEDASGKDLKQFRLWYDYAGTPEVIVDTKYNSDLSTYTLTFTQSCQNIAEKTTKEPMHIPILVGLLDVNGKELELQDKSLLELHQHTASFTFENIRAEPVPSLLRGFSAPVKLNAQLSNKQHIHLLKHDTDDVNRWLSAKHIMLENIMCRIKNKEVAVETTAITTVLRELFEEPDLDHALLAELIRLPLPNYLLEQMPKVEIELIEEAYRNLTKDISEALSDILLVHYKNSLLNGPYAYNHLDVAKRRLKNSCLSYLVISEKDEFIDIAYQQFKQANNMTDAFSALQSLLKVDHHITDQIIDDFYKRWHHEPLIINKWLNAQAASYRNDAVDRVKELTVSKSFDISNPNNVYSLFGGLAFGNPFRFHNKSGDSYTFIAKQVLVLDKKNPQLAARIMTAFTCLPKMDLKRQNMQIEQISGILKVKKLSKNVYEIADKILSAM